MEIAKKTLIVCSIIVGFLAALYFIYLSRMLILYLLIALILVIAIHPLVVKLQRKWQLKKVTASILSTVFLLVILFAVLGTIVTPLIIQGVELAQNLPAITARILSNSTFNSLDRQFHFADSLKQMSSNASAILLTSSSSFLLVAKNIVTIFTAILVILVLTFLLQIEGDRIWRRLMGFLNPNDAATAERIGGKIMVAVSGFVTGNLLISLIAGTVTLVTLWILDVPYMFALATLVALFDLIPLIGAAVATVIVGLIALTKSGIAAIIAVIVLLIYQFVEGHVIQPMVYSRTINLSALLVIIATILGAEIGGVIGILLAIPVAAVIQIVAMEVHGLLTKPRIS
jgi:predicted PurR-regulated permease PerM